MTDRGKIFAIYAGVAVISAAILGTAMYLGNRVPDQPVVVPDFVDAGGEKAETFFPIRADLDGVNQAGTRVKLSDLKGKVWIVAEFFAVCPHCAVRNGQEMRELFERFGDHPDFHIACISVDPTMDTPERLVDYSKALSADPDRWWFMSHPDEKATHDYLEQTLGFFRVKERKDPADIAANGRFAHDLGIMLVDREWNVVGKWPLADARSAEGRQRDPHLYEKLKADLHARVEAELEKNETAGASLLESADANGAEDAVPAND